MSTDFAPRLPCWLPRLALLIGSAFFALLGSSQAMLRAGPSIREVRIDPQDSLHIAIDFYGTGATSKDGGRTFTRIQQVRQQIPADWTTQCSSGQRRYVLIGNGTDLLRSEDGGAHWEQTSARKLLIEMAGEITDADIAEFWKLYGDRLPERSFLWHVVFALFALAHVLVCSRHLRCRGPNHSALINARALLLLAFIWCLLLAFQGWQMEWIRTLLPESIWNSSQHLEPGWFMGIAMRIAAQPLPLLLYLMALWPVLPGSLTILESHFPKRPWTRLPYTPTLAIAASALLQLGLVLAVFLEL